MIEKTHEIRRSVYVWKNKELLTTAEARRQYFGIELNSKKKSKNIAGYVKVLINPSEIAETMVIYSTSEQGEFRQAADTEKIYLFWETTQHQV